MNIDVVHAAETSTAHLIVNETQHMKNEENETREKWNRTLRVAGRGIEGGSALTEGLRDGRHMDGWRDG